MGKLPQVDILLPVYNGKKYLSEQLDSILSQSYKNIHLYIRNDGSKDFSQKIIEEYLKKDNRITFFKENGKNIGLVKSIEFLLNKSQSEYIMFCDQDDVWMINKIEVMIDEMLKYEKKYGVMTPILIHSNCFVTNKNLIIQRLFLKNKVSNFTKKSCFFNYYVQGASTLINKSLKNKGLPFIEGIYIHDRYFHILSELFGKRHYIKEPLMYYRQHEENIIGSSGILKKIKNNIKWNLPKFYHEKDRILITNIKQKYGLKDKDIDFYLELTGDGLSRIEKLKIFFKSKFEMRLKEIILMLK